MDRSKTELMIRRGHYSFDYECVLRNGMHMVMSDDLVFTEVSQASLIKPSFHLPERAVQMLMDELWACGIRPTQEGTAGQLKATERHLEDMRTLVFKEKTNV